MLNDKNVTRNFFHALLLLTAIFKCNAFNLDLSSPVIHWNNEGTMFGFSVALHKDKGFGWLIVGAPQGQTSQPGVVKGGTVYRCSIHYSNSCQSISFDNSGHSKIIYRGRAEQTDDKSHQWFGATVHSSGDSGIIVACAPRYIYFSSNLRRRDPIGTCWLAMSSFTVFREYSPCKTSAWGYHRQGSCQAGFSAVISKDGKQLFIGAVGSWYWQGQVFSQNILAKQSLFSTSEAPEYDDDSYMGYSVAVGEFNGDSNSDVAVGMPRGNNLTGKILLFNSTLYILQNITGEQIGSYFGYAVGVCDINGDGLDDVIVGAPLFSDLLSRIGSYETGKVTIVYQTNQHQFLKYDYLNGTYSKGRFGLAITSAGDINTDSYQDIAVGAPYAGDDGKGLVYIFHGSRKGIISKPSQIISGKDFGNPAFSTFGFSLSGGMDLDDNEYPDLLIGSYESDAVIFLKSRPVITAKPTFKIEPEIVNLEDKACSLQNRNLVSCIVVSFCLEYTGINIDADLGFLYETHLDIRKPVSRVYFLTDENHSKLNVSLRVRKDSPYCKRIYVYIQPDVRDKLEPITIQITYRLLEQNTGKRVLNPVLNDAIPDVLTKQVYIRKHCRNNSRCIPDLQLSAAVNIEQYFVGSDQRIEFEITVSNKDEDAFETMLYLFMPLDVNYINIDKEKSDNSVRCFLAEPTGRNDLICDIGNPLSSNSTIYIKVLLAPSQIISDASDFIFNVIVNSTNEELEETKFDNELEIHIPVKVKVDITLFGTSTSDVITYNKSEIMPTTKTTESDVGPEVTHIYGFGNRGPSTIQEAEVNILWPTYTLQGKNLLYLMEQPEVRGKGKCERAPDINPLSLANENKAIRRTGLNDFNTNKTLRWRKQREVYGREDPYVSEMFCGPTLCTRFYCRVFQLAKDEQVFFIIRSRLWKDTIDELGFTDVQISSKLITRITALPLKEEVSKYPYKVFAISTRLNTEDEITSKPIALWILLLAVCLGLLLLGLLALLLWKFGFFRRKRPQDEMLDTEPLSKYEKNGYLWSAEDVML